METAVRIPPQDLSQDRVQQQYWNEYSQRERQLWEQQPRLWQQQFWRHSQSAASQPSRWRLQAPYQTTIPEPSLSTYLPPNAPGPSPASSTFAQAPMMPIVSRKELFTQYTEDRRVLDDAFVAALRALDPQAPVPVLDLLKWPQPDPPVPSHVQQVLPTATLQVDAHSGNMQTTNTHRADPGRKLGEETPPRTAEGVSTED